MKKVRIEIHLSEEEDIKVKEIAKANGRSRKKECEQLLKAHIKTNGIIILKEEVL